MRLRAIWQFMDREVTHKIFYGPSRSWGPYSILWVTDRSINYHSARSAINYLVYYTQYMQICQTTFFCYCISKTKKPLGSKCGIKHHIDLARSIYYNIDRLRQQRQLGKNKNVKYSIHRLFSSQLQLYVSIHSFNLITTTVINDCSQFVPHNNCSYKSLFTVCSHYN